MRIVLIGYRGTGKTVVAGHLASLLGWDCVDTDDEIQSRTGKTIAAVFADKGEPYFRDVESAVLADLSTRDQIIISAGGGAVLRPQNRDALRKGSKVAWLRAAPETIITRMAADRSTSERRPALTAAGCEAEVVQLLAQRTPLYRQCADTVVDTDRMTPQDVATEILRQLELTPREQEPT